MSNGGDGRWRKFVAHDGIAAPLRHTAFRRIWLASLLSNLGLLIQGVGAAWAMTQLTTNAGMVALVQTAIMLPLLLIAIPAGAIADMYDRRKVAIAALFVSLTGASALFALAWLGMTTPWLLLAFCFVIGSGMALFAPAWQASVSEQVPAEALPAAIALNSISYNVARSFGPAIGGLVVAAAGAVAAFATNALLYLPLLAVLFRSKPTNQPPPLPPERLTRAIVSGVRYVSNSPRIRVVLARSLVMGGLGGSISALMPLVSRDLLGAGAEVYGMLLGAFGVGAVIGALGVSRLRQSVSVEASIRGCAMVMGLAIVAVGASRFVIVTAAALVAAGAGWMAACTLFNIAIQLSVPRWVSGRALALFQGSIAGGLALGSWFWGEFADGQSVTGAFYVSGALMMLSALLGRWLRIQPVPEGDLGTGDLLPEPEVRLAVTARSGPVIIEVEYRIPLHKARAFYRIMQGVELSRQRNGAYGWSIARDVADPELWTERYHCPTWLDYLRQRNRATQAERALQDQATDFHAGDHPIRVRRMLERPFGSVRWKDEAPDRPLPPVIPLAPQAGGGT